MKIFQIDTTHQLKLNRIQSEKRVAEEAVANADRRLHAAKEEARLRFAVIKNQNHEVISTLLESEIEFSDDFAFIVSQRSTCNPGTAKKR